MADAPQFTELELDALTELFNIGIGYAASAMNELLNEELTLSVPRTEILRRSSLADVLHLNARRICGVHQSVSGMLHANAHLLFPEDQSLELVRLMLGDSVPGGELTEMQQEALCEIGNIILNACVGAMANALGNECVSSLPSLYRGSMEQVLGIDHDAAEEFSLVIFIDFLVEKHEIHGYLVFLLDSITVADLKTLLGAFLKKIGA